MWKLLRALYCSCCSVAENNVTGNRFQCFNRQLFFVSSFIKQNTWTGFNISNADQLKYALIGSQTHRATPLTSTIGHNISQHCSLE